MILAKKIKKLTSVATLCNGKISIKINGLGVIKGVRCMRCKTLNATVQR